jgi:hypothetical protein
MRKPGRPKGPPKERKEFQLESSQVRYLEAIRASSPIGDPSMVSLVRQAVTEFVKRQMEVPEMKEKVDAYLGRVVKLTDVKNGRGK